MLLTIKCSHRLYPISLRGGNGSCDIVSYVITVKICSNFFCQFLSEGFHQWDGTMALCHRTEMPDRSDKTEKLVIDPGNLTLGRFYLAGSSTLSEDNLN